ncbi:uncharacterized protein LOC136028286 isoform X2 [Artemia franciscana]|uniref:Uncharacterized protein n=1 Tax=Artemia franciscana TaxID=6661 RepID=A0AA88HNJ0_ARTSF|nr:hypothetical protein QYM36_014530 [Artemia franciscana]
MLIYISLLLFVFSAYGEEVPKKEDLNNSININDIKDIKLLKGRHEGQSKPVGLLRSRNIYRKDYNYKKEYPKPQYSPESYGKVVSPEKYEYGQKEYGYESKYDNEQKRQREEDSVNNVNINLNIHPGPAARPYTASAKSMPTKL